MGLFIDNSDRTAPAAFNDADELQVSRRIEREQGSVYRINGKEARAAMSNSVRRRLDRRALAGHGRPGPHRRTHPGKNPRRAGNCSKRRPAFPACISRRHEAELRLKAAETNLERLEDVTAQLTSQIESLKRQARQANRFKQLSASIRAEEAKLLHIRWAEAKAAEAEADSQLNQTTNLVAERAQAQMEAAKTHAIEGLRMPELREAEAQAAAALQRLTIARSQLDEDFRRLDQRRQELERRIAQLSADIAREKQMIAGNSEILSRLDEEEEELRAHAEDAAIRAQELNEQLAEAAETVAEAERRMQALTAERAEAAAAASRPNAFLADIAQRRLRLERQAADARRDLETIEAKLAALPDPDEKREALEAAEIAHEDGEQAAVTAEKTSRRRAPAGSREPPAARRGALGAADAGDRGAHHIRKMLAAGGESAARPVSELIEAASGWETALGAALGDDLDSPLDIAAAKYWRLNPGQGDPALPAGVEPLSRHVTAPAELARRLAQIGVVSDADGARLMPSLAPASGWCRARARSGAGTGMDGRKPARRARRRCA